MTRRECIFTVMGTAFAQPLLSKEQLSNSRSWLTIAGPGWNRNGRRYSFDSLQSMAMQLIGKPVLNAGRDLWPDECDISSLVGVVSDAINTDTGIVRVRVRWMATPPSGGYLTPTGTARALPVWLNIGGPPDPRYHWIEDYTPTSLVFNEFSSFEEATKLI